MTLKTGVNSVSNECNLLSRNNVTEKLFFMFKTDCSKNAFSKKSDLIIGHGFVIYNSFQLAYEYPFGERKSLLCYITIFHEPKSRISQTKYREPNPIYPFGGGRGCKICSTKDDVSSIYLLSHFEKQNKRKNWITQMQCVDNFSIPSSGRFLNGHDNLKETKLRKSVLRNTSLSRASSSAPFSTN